MKIRSGFVSNSSSSSFICTCKNCGDTFRGEDWEDECGCCPPKKEKSYAEIGEEIGKLVQEKQEAYGDAHGKAAKVIEALYPDGIPVSAYTKALTIIRICDKLFRVATDNDPMGESPFRDIAGYGILMSKLEEGDEA